MRTVMRRLALSEELELMTTPETRATGARRQGSSNIPRVVPSCLCLLPHCVRRVARQRGSSGGYRVVAGVVDSTSTLPRFSRIVPAWETGSLN